MRFAHTNIISHDWKKLADFYIKVFKCTIVPPIRQQSGKWLSQGTGLDNAELKGVHLLLPGYGENGPTLEIYQYANIQPQNPVVPNKRGFGHIAFEVNSVESTLQSLLDNGGKSLGKITTHLIEDVGEITFVYARDPDGNIVELQQWTYL